MSDLAQHFQSTLGAFAQRDNPLRVDEALRRAMQQCINDGLADLPLPGQGQTLQRWRALAQVAGLDLALAKLFEGHTDAKAILHELAGETLDAPGIWGVWAAEPPSARVHINARSHDHVHLQGCKAWCSGALQIDHALLTAWDEQEQPQLVAVRLDQPGIRISERGWQATGMGLTASVEVDFEHALGRCVGASQEYLTRPGFWQGGAGIAACWYGAAAALAQPLKEACAGPKCEPHAAAHLGAVDAALFGAAAALRECAAWIDAHPSQCAQLQVCRTRAHVESAVETVLRHVGRALGATPFCRNPHFARLSTDLPVFIRQSHAERDLAGLGQVIAAQASMGWSL